MRRAIVLLGYGALVAGLPIAAIGLGPVNEYKAWGGTGVDCDAPAVVLICGTAGLLLYGAGAVLNGRRFGRPLRLVLAGVCLLICLGLAANMVEAVGERRLNEAAAETCG